MIVFFMPTNVVASWENVCKCKHGRDWRGGVAVAERSGVMEREGTRGTPESPSKMASLPFLKGFLAKTRELLRKHLTRPPWRCLLDK